MIFAGGCGKSKNPTGRVSGQVTHNEKPVTEGTITFRNDTIGIVAAMTLGPEGKYDLRYSGGLDIPVGDYFVTVTPPEPHEPIASEGGAKQPVGVREWPEFPRKYRNLNTSGEKFTVKEGANTYNLDMKSGAGK